MVPRVPYFGAGAKRVDGCFHKLAVKDTLFRFTEGLLQFSVHCTVEQESWGGGGGKGAKINTVANPKFT
jgi:hypothetical protein